MNASTKKHTSPGRLAELDLFEVEEHDTSTRRQAVPHEILGSSAANEGDSGYGCVEWYLYPHRPSSTPHTAAKLTADTGEGVVC
jgi:hypothetical protein